MTLLYFSISRGLAQYFLHCKNHFCNPVRTEFSYRVPFGARKAPTASLHSGIPTAILRARGSFDHGREDGVRPKHDNAMNDRSIRQALQSLPDIVQ
ncbi:MAG: hypothetical protein ACRER2_03900 [Methylococcales bacterium]